METVNLTIQVEKAFGNLCRPRCVLLALGDHKGRVLTGAKADFLPTGITRFIGGGINDGEDVSQAAIRETHEETGITLDLLQLEPLFLFQTVAKDREGNTFRNETYVFFAAIGDAPYVPSDDISEIAPLTLDELYQMGERYDTLQDFLWYKRGEREFCWADYGKMYGIMHKKTAEKLRDRVKKLA